MHTSFDLRPGVSLDDYRATLETFAAMMIEKGLLLATGPIMTRCKHPVMDTDDERGHKYFFVMTFRDREQCDAAVSLIKSADPKSSPVHLAVHRDIVDPIFSCWME